MYYFCIRFKTKVVTKIHKKNKTDKKMKNLKFDPNEVKFILHEESDGIRIEEKILLALVRESAEDCTSPEGECPYERHAKTSHYA